MDVDDDIDAELMSRFSCMGTDDKDNLIQQFNQLLGSHLTEQTCTFYLEMANWNLQSAICMYCDMQQNSVVPQMTLVKDVTVGEGEAVPPATRFIKSWRIRNSGPEAWPEGCVLRFVAGAEMAQTDRIVVSQLQPSQEQQITQEMTSPASCGVYQAQWRMASPSGAHFGEPIWVIIQVADDGLLSVTQQLSRIGQGDPSNGFTAPPPAPPANPFERKTVTPPPNPFELSSQGREGVQVSTPGRHSNLQSNPQAGNEHRPLMGSVSDPDLRSRGGEGARTGFATVNSFESPPTTPENGAVGVGGLVLGQSPHPSARNLNGMDFDEEML